MGGLFLFVLGGALILGSLVAQAPTEVRALIIAFGLLACLLGLRAMARPDPERPAGAPPQPKPAPPPPDHRFDYGLVSRIEQAPEGSKLAAFIDLETTGLTDDDDVTELAAALFSYDPTTGTVHGVVDSYSGLREPRCRIQKAASRVSGITMDMVRGKALDDAAVLRLLGRAELLIAHNAEFEADFLAKLYRQLAGRSVLCTMDGIDWPAHGCENRKLKTALARFGIKAPGHHRAGWDAEAGVALLAALDGLDRPLMAELLEIETRQADMLARMAPEEVTIPGKGFAFSGKFRMGDYEACRLAVESRGGMALPTLDSHAAYLALGSGSKGHSRRLTAALALRRRGVRIWIITEEQLVATLAATPVACENPALRAR